MKRKLFVLFGITLLVAALPALGEVRFAGCLDPNAPEYPIPCGFVGKGDVQSAFSWNNKLFQTKSGQIEFRLDDDTTYSWECEHFVKGVLKQSRTISSKQKIRSSEVSEVQRKNQQFLGWDLYGPVTLGGGRPSDFKGCPGDPGDPNGQSDWILVEDSVDISGALQLKACLGDTDDCRVLWTQVLDLE